MTRIVNINDDNVLSHSLIDACIQLSYFVLHNFKFSRRKKKV